MEHDLQHSKVFDTARYYKELRMIFDSTMEHIKKCFNEEKDIFQEVKITEDKFYFKYLNKIFIINFLFGFDEDGKHGGIIKLSEVLDYGSQNETIGENFSRLIIDCKGNVLSGQGTAKYNLKDYVEHFILNSIGLYLESDKFKKEFIYKKFGGK